MVFSSSVFLFLFLPLVLLLYFLAKKIEAKNSVLLFASLIFYAWGEPLFLPILILQIIVIWIFGMLVYDSKKRHTWMILSIIINLTVLGIFKYLGFICDNINSLFHTNIRVLIHLPIGISFFTFQAVSYIIDVYRKNCKPQKKLINVALYISFFPQLIAGPIVRYETIEKQINNRKTTQESFLIGVKRFISGLGKKTIIANNLAIVSDAIFLRSFEYGAILHWLGAVAYSLQILFDFSGYSDMAIGLGKMFGFDFEENFNYPYISKSVSEFWRRWHISLGTWFKDYVYIPLGGNRVKEPLVIRNLLIVWLLTGLWHGANWTFVIWGCIYFLVLTVEKKLQIEKLNDKLIIIPHIYTMFVVMIGWVVFKADNVISASQYICSLFGPLMKDGDLRIIREYISEYLVFFLMSIPLLIPIKEHKFHIVSFETEFSVMKTIFYIAIFLLSVSYVIKSSYNPFIYFNF